MINIIGYYRRERDNNEYIHYIEDGVEHLTSGVNDWNNRNDKGRIQRYQEQLIKVDEIDFTTMRKRLNKSMPFSQITNHMNNLTNITFKKEGIEMFYGYDVEKSEYGYVISQEVLEACLQNNKVDFNNCYFENIIFDGEKIQATDLQFENARFSGCRFENMNLNGSSFAGATLTDCTFSGTNLENVDLKKSYIRYTSFVGTNINESDFSFAVFQQSRFGDGTILQNTKLLRAEFADTVFHQGFQFDQLKGLQYVDTVSFRGSSGTAEEVKLYSDSVKSILAKGMVELISPEEPIVHIVKSELPELEGKYLPMHEADTILANIDAQINADSKQEDYTGPYYRKVTCEVLYKQDGEEKQFTHRIDVGNGHGGLLDSIQREYESYLNTEDGLKLLAEMEGENFENEKVHMEKWVNEYIPSLRELSTHEQNNQEQNVGINRRRKNCR